jgi:hypothetical protein
LGHKITNAPLIWKVGDIIFFSWAKLIMGQFSGKLPFATLRTI